MATNSHPTTLQLEYDDGKGPDEDAGCNSSQRRETVDSVFKVFASKIRVVLRVTNLSPWVTGASSAGEGGAGEGGGAAVPPLPSAAWESAASSLCVEWRDACVLHRSMRLIRVSADTHMASMGGGAGFSRNGGGGSAGAGVEQGWLQPSEVVRAWGEEFVGEGGGAGGGRVGASAAKTDVIDDLRVRVRGMRCSYEGAGVRHTVFSCCWGKEEEEGGVRGEGGGGGGGRTGEEEEEQRRQGCSPQGQKRVYRDAVSALSLFSGSDGAGVGTGGEASDDGKYPFHGDVAGIYTHACARARTHTRLGAWTCVCRPALVSGRGSE